MDRNKGEIEMDMPTRFMINDRIVGSFASHGPDHLCIVFFENGERIGSFCAEAPCRTDYLPEYRPQDMTKDFGVTFDEAVHLAMERK